MGLYARLTFEDGLEIEFPDIDGNPLEITWQTKSLPCQPMVQNYKITADGRLFQQDTESETVPEEERPMYNEEIGGFEKEYEKGFGSFRTIHHGWSDTEYHGTFEFHTSIEDDYISLEAKFTDGQLVEITRNN